MADNFVQSDVAADAADASFTQQAFDEQPEQPAADVASEADEADAPEAEPAQDAPAPKPNSGPDLNAPRPVPGSLPLPPGAAPAPTMDYRLFYLNNAAKFTKGNGQPDENRLNAAFFQTVRQTGARVENVSDQEFGKRLKAAGANLPEAQVQQVLKQANKGYGDYEKGRFNAFAGTLRNAGLNTAYNRRRGYITVQDNLDTRPADETAAIMGMSARSHSDAGMTAADQISQYYDQSNKALGNDATPFRQNEVESQKARDFYQEGDKQVFVGSTKADGSPLISNYTVAKPMLSPTDLVTAQVDLKTGLPRLVVWRNDVDAVMVENPMNIQALLPKPATTTVAGIISSLIPTIALTKWIGDESGNARQEVETDGWGVGNGAVKGLAAVGAGIERLTAFEKGASKYFADQLGDYNFTIGESGFQRKTAAQEKARLQGLQSESYRTAAQVQGNLNTDQAGTMFSGMPAFFYNVTQQIGQQAVQQGLNVMVPGAGFAYMAAGSGEQALGDVKRAGGSDGMATGLSIAMGMLTYASESIFDIGIAKYGRKLLTGGFEAELGAEIGRVLKNEKAALIEGVMSEARQRGLKNLTAIETTAIAEKLAPRFLQKVQLGFNDAIAAMEKKAVGQMGIAIAKEGSQEVLDQSFQTGAYTAGRQLGFEDGHGKLKDDLAPWVRKSLEDGSSPLAEKGWNQIMEDWYQAGIAGGLMGGVFGALGARGMARHATLAQAAEASAAEHRDRQIATYLTENNFTPDAAQKLRDELKVWHGKHQLGVRTRVDGQPADEQGSDSENTLVYHSLLNKVNVLQRLAQDTNLRARLTPTGRAALVEELVKYGNDNVRTKQGLDTLYRVHEQQQDLQRLLEGKAVRERNPLTGESAPLDEASEAVAPGYAGAQALGMSPETYKLELDRRRAAIEAMAEDSSETGTAGSTTGKSAQLKQLEDEAGRSQDAGALGVITRNRAVGAWYETNVKIQELEGKLATTDGSQYQQRTALRAELQEAQLEAAQQKKLMAQAVSQSSDGSLSRVQQIAEGQLNLNALRGQSLDVFNGNLVKTHLQEGYLRFQHKALSEQLTPEVLASLPLVERRSLEYQRDFLEAAFTSQPDGGVHAINDYNIRRKEFIAQRAAEQQQALSTATATNERITGQLAALGSEAQQVQAAPTPEGIAALNTAAAGLTATAQLVGAAPETHAPVVTALRAIATHLANTARATALNPALRAPALQAILDEENQLRRQRATDAGQNPDEVFLRTPEFVAQDPDLAAEYDEKVNEQLKQQAPPEVAAQNAQAEQLRETADKLAAVPAYAAPAVQDENYLESLWATHFAPAGNLAADPGAAETVQPDGVRADGTPEPSITGLPGRISKLQETLKQRENESEAAYATRVDAVDMREVDDLIAQAHYHLAQLRASLSVNNRLAAAGVLDADTNRADLRLLDPALGQQLARDYTEQYLPDLDKIKAVLQGLSGSRFAEDDEYRSLYLTQRGRQLETFVAQTAVAGVDAALLQQARALLQQLQALTATSRSPETLTQGTVLLSQAEELLRQAFAEGSEDAQRVRRQQLYQEVLAGIELKFNGNDLGSTKPTDLKNDLQRYRQGLSYRGESEDGIFMTLQQLFGINRAQWSQHYAAVGRQISAGTDRFGLSAPLASLEQEQAVLGINAFFQSGDELALFPADSVLGKHIATQADVMRKGPVNGSHAIPAMGPASRFISRFLLYVTGFPGAGKCLAKGTPVLMHDFSIKKVEDVVEGDLLMGPDGKPRTALGIARGQEMMYRVTQVNGMSYVVNESHILSLKKSGRAWVKGVSTKKNPKPLPASDELVNISVREYLTKNDAWKSRHKGWKPACMDFEYQHVALSPYFLGLWLGDGSSDGIDITSMDSEVVDFLRDYAKTEGFEVRVYDKNNGKCPRYAIVNPDGAATTSGRDCLRVRMKALNLLDNKHIPLAFLKNAEWMRLQLLAGLIDSDGHNAGTYYEITQTRESLANDIATLARSLGFCARVTEKQTSLKSRNYIGKAYRVTISGDVQRIPARVERKRIVRGGTAKNLLLTGVSVTPEKVDDYYGFTIDGDSLFLLADFTVTHNTQMVAGTGLATLASLRGATKENPLRIVAVAPHADQRTNLNKALTRSSDALQTTVATVSELLSQLQAGTIQADAVVLDEATILSSDEGNQLFEHLEILNAARAAQGAPALKVLALGDPAQLSGRNAGGGRQAIHLFVQQTQVIKFQLPTLRQIYRSGFVVMHQLQEELRNRILMPVGPGNELGAVNGNLSPVGQMAFSIDKPGQFNTLGGVQYQDQDAQRQQIVEHIRQIEAAIAADPTSPEARRTLRVIVSENDVNKEIAALTALGIGNAAGYVTKQEPHGVLDVEKAQGQEFDFVYAAINETEEILDNKRKPTGKRKEVKTSSLRALNVAVSRAERYVSVRLSELDKHRVAELNNQQSSLQQFPAETAENRTARTAQKLALLDAVAQGAPKTGPAPQANTSGATTQTAAADNGADSAANSNAVGADPATAAQGKLLHSSAAGEIRLPMGAEESVFADTPARGETGTENAININPAALSGVLLTVNGVAIARSVDSRFMVVAKVGNSHIPFYKSSSGTSGKIQGAWYPFFGYTGRWIVKGSVDKATGAMEYNAEISAVQALLNEHLVFNADVFNVEGQITSANDGRVMFTLNDYLPYKNLYHSVTSPDERQNVEDFTGYAPSVNLFAGLDANGNSSPLVWPFINAAVALTTGSAPVADPVNNTPLPASTTAAVARAVDVLRASADTDADGPVDELIDAETADDRDPDAAALPLNPARQLAGWVGALDERAEDTLAQLEAEARALRTELKVAVAANASPLALVEAQEVLTELEARADALAADLLTSRANAVSVPDELALNLPAGTSTPGQQGGISMELDANGLPTAVSVWKPEFDSDGQFSGLREMPMPTSELQDANGQPKSPLGQLRSTRAWLNGQIRDLENKRTMLEKSSVTRLAAENKVILHGHVMQAVSDEKARQQRLKSKNSFTSRIYEALFGQRNPAATTPGINGTLSSVDFMNVLPATGTVPFNGNGTFYLVHHASFIHGRGLGEGPGITENNLFTIRYQEGKGAQARFMDIGVLRNNSHERLQPGEIHAAKSQTPASALDRLLSETAQRQARQASADDYDQDPRNELGPDLAVENFRAAPFQAGLVSAASLSLEEKYARYEQQGLGASRPYVVTVSGTDNVRFGQSDYLVNNKENPNGDTRASMAGGAVIFTSQGRSHAQVTALVDDVLTKAQAAGWSNQRTVDYLLKEHNLEMDIQEELPLTLADYLGGVQQTQGFTFANPAALDAALTTRSGLDKQGRNVPVFKQTDGDVRKNAWQANRGGWSVKRSLFNMAQARPARLFQNPFKSAVGKGLHPDAYRAYGLLNKLTSVLVDSGIAVIKGGQTPIKQTLELSPRAVQALSLEQAKHLAIILNSFSGFDRHLSNDADSTRSYETRYNHDLIRYLGYLDQHGALKGAVTKAWDNDTQGLGKTRVVNQVQFRPSFLGKATGPFTRMADVPGLNVDQRLASHRTGMSDPSFVVNLSGPAARVAPVAQAAGQLNQNAQQVAQQAQTTGAVNGGSPAATPVTPSTPATAQPAAPEQGAGEIGGGGGKRKRKLELNVNDRGVSLGDASPAEFIAEVKEAFGNAVPWAFDLIGNFGKVLGAVIGETITVNRAANGLVDRRTIKHEMVHYALRIVDPAYAALVYKDAREKLMPAENVQPDVIAAMSDQQVNEWLSKHYERVHRDYEKRGEIFKRRTKYIPDSILRLYRALRGIYDYFNTNTDYTDRLFGDLAAGLFRGRRVQSAYRGTPRNADGSVDLSRVEFNRNAQGQRQHDFLELEKRFGSPGRRQQALNVITTYMQSELNDFEIGKPFRNLTGALNAVRADLVAEAAETTQMMAHPVNPFVLDNHSTDPAVARRTRNYLLVKDFQQDEAEVDGEKQARGLTTPLDVLVSYLYPNLKVNNAFEAARDPYAQDEDEAISGSDGDQDSNGESAGAKANNISGRAYYLEDKNKAAKPGAELGLLLQTIPLYVKNVATGQFERDRSGRTVDLRSVNSILKRAVAAAGREVLGVDQGDQVELRARQGRADVTLEDVRRHLLQQFHGQEGQASFATGNRRDAVASLYLKLFGGVSEVRADGSFVSDAVPVDGYSPDYGPEVYSTPFSMYQVAYPQRAGANNIAAQLVDHTRPEVAAYALHFQRLLSQLLGHYTSTQRREYLSVDFTSGIRDNKDVSLENALSKRKNYNQQGLLNTFYTLKGKLWQPSSTPLTALKKAGFTLSANPDGAGGAVLNYLGNPVLHLGQYQQGAGQGYTATGTFDAGMSDKTRAKIAHKLLTLAGLPFDQKQLTEMLGSTEENGQSGFSGFEDKLGELLARVWTSALGDSLSSNLHPDALQELGATDPAVRAYLTGALAETREGRDDFGNYDDLNAIDGQGYNEGRAPQFRLSPTAHFSLVLGLAQFQNDYAHADVRSFAYSADGEKIFLEQLGNGLYPRLNTLREQRQAHQALLAKNWQPGQPKQLNQVTTDPVLGRINTMVAMPFDNDLFAARPGEYSNGVADGSFKVVPFQVNGLSDSRTNRKKSMVSATAKELHKLAVEHLFASKLINSGGKVAQFFGAVISDKATQRIFELRQQKQAPLLLGHEGAAGNQALANVFRSYRALLREQVLPRYAAAGFGLSKEAQADDAQLLHEMARWLQKQTTLPKNLVKNIDHNGKFGLNADLVHVLTQGEAAFVAASNADAREDARRMHADGYTSLPAKVMAALVSNKLLPELTPAQQALFHTEVNNKGVVETHLTRAVDAAGKVHYHPLVLAYANSAFVHGHALITALDGHHLNYNGTVDRAKRGIINATNYESYDVRTARGLGLTSKLLVIADLDFTPVAQGQTFGLLDGYDRFKMDRLARKEAQDGQGYMSVLHALLEDESYGGKYMRPATPAEMVALGGQATDFPRRIADFGTRKNIHGNGHGANGAAELIKDSKTILTNNYVAVGNEKIYDLVSKMLGGYDSPLYERWRQIHDGMKSLPNGGQLLAANADWYQLYDEFIQPENRRLWEPHHFGLAAHPSAFKVGESQKISFLEPTTLNAMPHLSLDNRQGGKVLMLGQDPAGASISRITQEDHIISLLGDNYRTAQDVYGLLGQLASSGLLNLDDLIIRNGGTKPFFMARLQDLMLNLGTAGNTLSLVRDGADANVPLLLQPLHSAISSSIKQYSTKLRNKGLRATVQSSTGLVQLYNVLDADGSTHRLTKPALVNQGYATVGDRGQIVPTERMADYAATELDFMHLTENGTGRKLGYDEAKAVMQRRLRYEQMGPAEQQAFEQELEGYTMRPMEMLIARDFVKAFNIPADMDVADVNRQGVDFFIEQERKKPGVEEAEAQRLGQLKWENWSDILYVKGTRIPVTNLNSIQMGVVVGFHDGSQNVALVPSEMLLIAGADNDGDMITLEFLDLDKQGLRHQDQVNAAGEARVHERGIREQILTSKRDDVLLNPFNMDQLFKPIDFARFGDYVSESARRNNELRESDEVIGYQAFGTGDSVNNGAARSAENLSQWIINQAGKSGVGPMVKAREAFNALHNYSRALGGPLQDFAVPSYWMGRQVSSGLDNPREVSYLFEDFANAALDNAKENYLGNLNFAKDTWGVYSALIMTRQNLDEIMSLMTHPYAKKMVQGVQRKNTVNAKFKPKTLAVTIAERLQRQAPQFDEAGARSNNVVDAQGVVTTSYTGFGYAGQGLFAAVQARQQELHERHAAGEADVYPDLAANVGREGGLTEAQRHATERYVLENLYLAAVRGDELLEAQGVLATMDGVEGTDYDNQRALDKVITALPLYEKDKHAQLVRLLDASEADQQAWAAKYHGGTKTINAGALFANNPFVQSSIRAILKDQAYKQSLFLARQPALQARLQQLVKTLSKFNNNDARAAHKLVMRGLDDFIAHDFLRTNRPDISLEAQAANPLLAALASCELSTIAGRTRFGQLSAAYVQEVKVRERHDPGNPGVQDSPLVQELTLSGGNYGQALALNNATDLDPENKQVLESLFSELGDAAKHGVEGPALQQVLLYYNLSRNGLHLGRGSLAEVLSAQALRPVSEHVAQLAAKWKAAGGTAFLQDFESQLISQNPGMSTELKDFVRVSEADAQQLEDADPVEQGLRRRGSNWLYAEPGALPDVLSLKLAAQHAGVEGQFDTESGNRKAPKLDEFLHIKNQKSEGKDVLYRRSGPDDQPVWRRQYSALNPAVNNFGEYGYSPLPVLERTQAVDFNGADMQPTLRAAQLKAIATGQVRKNGSFELKATGNELVNVDKNLRCR